MASPAHCYFCFEVLTASYQKRTPPALQKVLDAYDKYTAGSDAAEEHGADLLGPGQSGEQVDDDQDDHDGANDDNNEEAQRIIRRAAPANPSISRLQASSSSSRSSSTSSPSVKSSSSSNTQYSTSSSDTTTTTLSTSTPPVESSRVSLTESYPLFVTWNTLSRSGHKALRGCIGTFEPLPLASGLASYALTSAFDDTRFSPIPSSLVPSLSCSLTLLANFEPCRDAMDWTLGAHGLRISFNHRNRRHGATYLPDVAVEQGWTREETVESLMKKAGWDGGYGHGVARRLLRGAGRSEQQQSTKPWDEVADFKAVRYTGLKSTADHKEWKEWRSWVDKTGGF